MGAWIEIKREGTREEVNRRPRMGAWIEIHILNTQMWEPKVAPVWGRGLK